MSSPPAGAMCAAHPQRNAISTCTRCGNFMCVECHGSTGAPPPSGGMFGGPEPVLKVSGAPNVAGLCPPCVSRQAITSEFAPCYNCNAQNAARVNYTWWGGVLGPRLFTHVRCTSCGTTYNGKSGKSNTTNIIIYYAVILGVFLAIGIAANLN